MHGNLKCMSCEAKNKSIYNDLLNEIGGYTAVDDEGKSYKCDYSNNNG